MELRILVADRPNIGFDIDYSALARFGGLEIRDAAAVEGLGPVLAARRPDIVVANRCRFDAAALEAGRPRLVCLTATGTNTVDLAAARRLGVAVCNVVGYSTDSVAQHTFALALALLNRPESRDAAARAWPSADPASRVWTDLARPIRELAGKRWGIIGLGAIGRRVAALAAAFGCEVAWASVSGAERPEAWPRRGVDDLLAESDIVSIHCPINDHSRGLLGPARLARMKPGSLLLNLGRGGIVDEAALAAALLEGDAATGRPGLAALDVLAPEPPDNANPLFAVPPERLILTPHVAWAALEARQRVVDECALNIESWLSGGRRNRVD